MSTHLSISVRGYAGTQEELIEALKTVPGVEGVRLIVTDPDIKLPTAGIETPPEANARADAWLGEQMKGYNFVRSELGGHKLGGKQGYFSSGPGLSAITIFNFFRRDPEIINVTEQYPHHPIYSEDFERCLALFERVPEWKARISELAVLSSTWAKLIDRWDLLERTMLDAGPTEVNQILKNCQDDAN